METLIFAEDFATDKLSSGWTWIREDPQLWRVTSDGLLIHTLSGGMWTESQTPPRNILLRAIQCSIDGEPAALDVLPSTLAIEVSVKLNPEMWGTFHCTFFPNGNNTNVLS